MDIDFFEGATDVVLEVEVNPNAAARFESRYSAAAGSNPRLGVGYQHQPNKWGLEVRVYFNSPIDMSDEFTSVDVYVEQGKRPYRKRWTYRLNDREFFWALVDAGYRLGEN
jgi:hypothetical protein